MQISKILTVVILLFVLIGCEMESGVEEVDPKSTDFPHMHSYSFLIENVEYGCVIRENYEYNAIDFIDCKIPWSVKSLPRKALFTLSEGATATIEGVEQISGVTQLVLNTTDDFFYEITWDKNDNKYAYSINVIFYD